MLLSRSIDDIRHQYAMSVGKRDRTRTICTLSKFVRVHVGLAIHQITKFLTSLSLHGAQSKVPYVDLTNCHAKMTLPRNKTFLTNRQSTLSCTHAREIEADKVDGPVAFFNPTQALFEGKSGLHNPVRLRTVHTNPATEVTRP